MLSSLQGTKGHACFEGHLLAHKQGEYESPLLALQVTANVSSRANTQNLLTILQLQLQPLALLTIPHLPSPACMHTTCSHFPEHMRAVRAFDCLRGKIYLLLCFSQPLKNALQLSPQGIELMTGSLCLCMNPCRQLFDTALNATQVLSKYLLVRRELVSLDHGQDTSEDLNSDRQVRAARQHDLHCQEHDLVLSSTVPLVSLD